MYWQSSWAKIVIYSRSTIVNLFHVSCWPVFVPTTTYPKHPKTFLFFLVHSSQSNNRFRWTRLSPTFYFRFSSGVVWLAYLLNFDHPMIENCHSSPRLLTRDSLYQISRMRPVYSRLNLATNSTHVHCMY